MIKLAEVYIGHQLGFYMVYGVCKRLNELIEVLFIKEYLMLFVRKSIILKPLLTLSYRQIIVIGAGRLDIEKIRSLACLHF